MCMYNTYTTQRSTWIVLIKYNYLEMVISYKFICLILLLLCLIAQQTKTKPAKYRRPSNECEAAARQGTVGSRNYTKNRIIDGEDAEFFEFKDHVSLSIYRSKEDKNYACGGVLIEKMMILTAGHCVIDVTEPKHVLALNTHTPPKYWNSRDRQDAIPIAEICISQSFWELEEKIWFDYAVLRLKKPFEDYEVGKLSEDVVTFQDDLTAVGIGLTHYDANDVRNCIRPFKLQKLDMVLVECDEFNSGDTHICFTSKNGGDVCFGDSGSPVYNDNDKVVAITSYGGSDEVCLHNHKAKSVFANVVDNREEVDVLLRDCRGPTERPQEDDDDDLGHWGELREN